MQDTALAEMASAPLPLSDEEMDSSSRKRGCEAASEEDEAAGHRKQPPSAPPCSERTDVGGTISRHSGETVAT